MLETTPNAASTASFLSDERWQRFALKQRQANLVSALGVSDWEDGHTNILAWLLSPSQSHGLQSYAMQCLLELLASLMSNDLRDWAVSRRPEIEAFCRRLASVDELCVEANEPSVRKLMQPADEQGKGLVDLYLEPSLRCSATRTKQKLRILLENKIDSGETISANGQHQTTRYWEAGEEMSRDDGVCLLGVYLTPLPTHELLELSEPQCACKEFLQINYQLLLEHVLLPSLKRCPDEHARVVIQQYIASLGYSRERANEVMAVPPEDREELRALLDVLGPVSQLDSWRAECEKHSTLFAAFIATLDTDRNLDKKKRDILKRLGSSMPLEFVVRVGQKLSMPDGWSVTGGERTRQIVFDQFTKHMQKLEKHKWLREIRLYIGPHQDSSTEMQRGYLRLQFTNRGGGKSANEQGVGHYITMLLTRISADPISNGARISKAGSLDLCTWNYSGLPDRIEEEVKSCMDTINKLTSLVQEWFSKDVCDRKELT